ncbi:MAG: U32 family peptidase [Planctomycetales bacterium]|nr:U32 family peptidase [Planctomycetales bacterium]
MIAMSRADQVELLAPAGNWQCAHAAVENGADAIYFGLDIGFNARARATNFHIGELRQLMLMLHRQDVRGYVTLNTLVFTDELLAVESSVRQLADAGVDAVLVQDLGLARVVRELCPQLAVHASTQMTLTNATAIEMARQLGVQRVVLARELSLKEIRSIASDTNMPLEAFVHGALCVAYSGQCLTSESLGGRSANRGQCAQACRLPYELLCDGQPRDLGNVKYLLSPQDLAAHDLVPELIDAGICSLKIEGRLKTAEYVANVCSHYRAAIDAALAGQARKLNATQQQELELSFSRGFSPGWLEGCDHKLLVPGTSSAKRGIRLGEVSTIRGDQITVDLHAPLATGDGIVIEGDRANGHEIGGRVYELFQNDVRVDRAESGLTVVGLKRGTVNQDDVPFGASIWKTDDPQLSKRLRQSYESADPTKRVPVNLRVQAAVGQAVIVHASTKDLPEFELRSEHVCQAARKHAVSTETLVEQFSRLGGTVYRLGTLSAEICGTPMVPLSVLGQLRRELVQQLDLLRVTKPLPCTQQPVATRMLEQVNENVADQQQSPGGPKAAPIELRVLCRSLEQLQHCVAAGATNLIADFHDIRQYRQAIQVAHAHQATIELATLRIHKPGEDGLFRAFAKLSPDGWLARNLAAIRFCQEHNIPFAADFSLNVTNPLTAQQLINWGTTRVTASYDLNRDQLFELVQQTPAQWLEVVIHQHMPMFHMEHCVFCSVLSPGRNKSDCGRPCDRHDVRLADRLGAEHVLHADIGCRNTLYNSQAQSGAETVKPLLELGVRKFRVELLRDAPESVIAGQIDLYRRLLAGQLSGTQVWRELKADNRVGVTRGTLEHPRNPLAIL